MCLHNQTCMYHRYSKQIRKAKVRAKVMDAIQPLTENFLFPGWTFVY